MTGRFLQTDPVGYKADLDLYSYVTDDPLNRGDPLGLYDCTTETVCARIGKALKDIDTALGAKHSPLTAAQKKELAAIKAYLGTKNDHNGIAIRNGRLAAGTLGITEIGGKHKATITLDFNQIDNTGTDRGPGSVVFAGVLIHEGTHAHDQASGVTPNTYSGFISLEHHGYTVESYIMRAFAVFPLGADRNGEIDTWINEGTMRSANDECREDCKDDVNPR
jgi:hypothetical protein